MPDVVDVTDVLDVDDMPVAGDDAPETSDAFATSGLSEMPDGADIDDMPGVTDAPKAMETEAMETEAMEPPEMPDVSDDVSGATRWSIGPGWCVGTG